MRYRFLNNLKEHLHQLSENGEDWKNLTGTSSVGSVLARPLTWWAAGMAVGKLGWLNPKKYTPEECAVACEEGLDRIKSLERDEFAKLLNEAYRAHNERKNEAAEEGINLHSELEKYVKSQMGIMQEMSVELLPKIQPFVVWAKVNVKKFLWSEAHCYSEKLWVGGVSDAGAELNDGRIAVIDFKSSKEVYSSQFLQAAGYAIQIEENGLFDISGKRTKKIGKKISSLIIVPFGAEEIVPETRNDYEVDEYKKGFEAAVQLYRLLGLEKNINAYRNK